MIQSLQGFEAQVYQSPLQGPNEGIEVYRLL